MGETRPVPGVSVVPLNKLEDGGEDGCFVNQKCMGSYIHGILDNQAFIDYLLEPYAENWSVIRCWITGLIKKNNMINWQSMYAVISICLCCTK